MKQYKLIRSFDALTVCVLLDGKNSIPFDPANTDYQQFKKYLAEGGELQDAEGQVMTPEAVQAFVATLP